MPALAIKSVSARASVRPSARPARRAVVVQAKYGDNSRYFDLGDMENSTGAWDMYGQDEKKRYPDLQNTFFLQAADVLSRREALRAFVALSGVGSIAYFGVKGSFDVSLPITKGPIGTTENGKGGALRSKL